MAKNALLKFKSPRGVLEWVTITGEGKENMSGKMKYVCSLVVAQDDPIIQKIEDFWKEHKPSGFKKKAKSLGFAFANPLLDEDGNKVKDDEDQVVYDKEGPYHLRFSTDVAWPDGKSKIIRTYNAKGSKVALGEKQIGNGSEGKVAGAMGIYTNEVKGKIMDAGVTLYLNDIQLFKFVEYSEDAGFEDEGEDDGWTGEDDTFEGVSEDQEEAKAKPRL